MKNSFAGLFLGSSSMSMPNFVWIRWTGSKLLQKHSSSSSTCDKAVHRAFRWELKMAFSRPPPLYNKMAFLRPPIHKSGIFETPLYKKMAFSRPPIQKWHFKDPPPYKKNYLLPPPLPIFKRNSPKPLQYTEYLPPKGPLYIYNLLFPLISSYLIIIKSYLCLRPWYDPCK